MSPLLASFRRFLRYKRPLALGILCVPLSSLGDIWITMLVGDALDRLRAGDDPEFLRGLFLLLLVIAAARSVGSVSEL